MPFETDVVRGECVPEDAQTCEFFSVDRDCNQRMLDLFRQAREALRADSRLMGVLVVPHDGLWSQTFAETWRSLPSRIASLAIRPPDDVGLVIRSTKNAQRLIKAQSRVGGVELWRMLVELAKTDTAARFEVITNEPTSVASSWMSRTNTVNDDWMPATLLSPRNHQLDWLFDELSQVRRSDLGGSVVSPEDATAVQAGLWLLHGDGDSSHRHSQTIEDLGRHRCGNYWHAIMHRLEPDYANSKYWFRRVGDHPNFLELARRAQEQFAAHSSESVNRWRSQVLGASGWNPLAFVDWCEFAHRTIAAEQIALIRRIQFLEMHLLLRASYRDAIGDS
jgi:hypothetical protein